jgi:hypothetical protein
MVSLLTGVEFLKEFGVFTAIMPFLLIFTVSYGFLSYIKPFGEDSTTINSVLAFVIGFMALQFMPILIFVQLIVPYLFGFFLIILMIWILFKFMGVSDETLTATAMSPGVYGTVLGIIMIGVFVFIGESIPAFNPSNQEDIVANNADFMGVDTPDGSQTAIISTNDDGSTTVISSGEQSSGSGFSDQNLLRNTIFHPAILSMIIMFMTFGIAAYMVTVIKEV